MPHELASRLVTLSGEISEYIKRERCHICKTWGLADLTELDFAIFNVLRHEHPEPARSGRLPAALEQAKGRKVTSSTLWQALARLDKCGLVAKSPEDGSRDRLVSLTEEGLQISSALQRPKKWAEHAISSVISRMGSDVDLKRALQQVSLAFPVVANTPNVARIYDYWLGGKYHLSVDAREGEALVADCPQVKLGAIANRGFLRRAVRFIAEQGVEQFIDVGAGLPTAGNTHEVVDRIAPGARVVYVDSDEFTAAESQTLLETDPNRDAVHAALDDPSSILRSEAVRRLIDFSKPVGLVAVSVLHFVIDDPTARGAIAALCAPMESGGYLALAHGTEPPELAGVVGHIVERYRRTVKEAKVRRREEILQFFEGMHLVEPGRLVYAPEWHPEVEDPYESLGKFPATRKPFESLVLVGVGRISPQSQTA